MFHLVNMQSAAAAMQSPGYVYGYTATATDTVPEVLSPLHSWGRLHSDIYEYDGKKKKYL